MDPIQAKFHHMGHHFTWRGQDYIEENDVGKSNTLPIVTEIEYVVPWPRLDARPKIKQGIEKMKLTNKKSHWKQYYKLSTMVQRSRIHLIPMDQGTRNPYKKKKKKRASKSNTPD